MIDISIRKVVGNFLLEAAISDENFICLTGKNGSGKTTLLTVVAGMASADSGHIRVNGIEVGKLSMEKRRISFVGPESYIPHLDVDSHLLYGARLRGIKVSRELTREVKELFGIVFGGPVRSLSLGMRERVALATSLLSGPDVILIDEAFANIDNRAEVVQSFRRMSTRSKIDVIFTTQDSEDLRLADHLYRLESGKSSRVF